MRGGAVAARRAHNPKVAGSSPAPATLKAMMNSWSLFLRSARCAQVLPPLLQGHDEFMVFIFKICTLRASRAPATLKAMMNSWSLFLRSARTRL